MNDPTEQIIRRGLAELIRDKPALGPVDLEAVTATPPPRGSRGSGDPNPVATRWLMAAAVFVLVAGVGVAGWLSVAHDGRVDTAEPQQGPGQLVGTRWLATKIGDQPARPDRAGVVPFLIFESAERVRGNYVCNRMTASYRLDGDRLRFSRSRVTQMGCRDTAAIEQQAKAYGNALRATDRVQRDGATLTLLDSAGATLVVFRAAPTPDPSKTLMFRVRNDTKVDFARVQAGFPDKTTIDFGSVETGQNSDYRQVGGIYGYSYLRIRLADGRELDFQPMEYVSETPLAPGRYTYVLGIDGKGLKAAIGLSLEADQ